jgi:two-component system, OmpR family, sensor kinase
VTGRRALAVFAAVAALLLGVNALVYSLYRSEVIAVNRGLDDRLTALGTTAAKWLATGGDALGALNALVAENRLEDAYLVDAKLDVVAGVRTKPGRLNLLRVDEDRLGAALAGTASVGDGYSVAQAEVEVAYFPVQGRVLALEAGAEYHEPATRLRATYLITVLLTVVIAIAVAAGLLLALRALERARLAHGRAERLAAVGQMAAMVAHEVRNPLGILRGQVELANERITEAPPRERERFGEMLTEIDRLTRLTDEFLSLARDVPLDLAPTDLQELASSIAADVCMVASEAKVEVAAEPNVTVPIDANKIRQAIRNLALNAVQIGGAGVTVKLEVARTGDRARVTVADDGPGVPAEIASTLFEPFTTGRPGGTGLGLAIARRVAERHGGTLVLESTPGERGARFSMYLPI